MNETQRTSYTERLKTSAEARQALLSRFVPRAAVQGEGLIDRKTRKAAELVEVRRVRAQAKADRLAAAAAAQQASLDAEANAAAAELDARRGERKERKALTKAEAKAKRDARYAARKARA